MNCENTPRVLLTTFALLPLLFFSVAATAADKIDVVESETGFYYTIQKGDTLWDLSRQFSDSPWLWPELWEENDQISNPHWIFPGERIRLYRKSGEQALVGEKPAPPMPLPAVETVPAPTAGQTNPYFLYSSIDKVGFIRKPPVPAEGTIMAVQGKKTLISEEDIVYLRPAGDAADSAMIPGKRYCVFRYMSPTDDLDSTETIGTQHYLLGLVEVVKREPDLAIAKVLKSYRPIREKDLIMTYVPHSGQIPLKPSSPGIEGAIITSEEHRNLTGDLMLAFIDKGRADNIQVGQEYSIYRQQEAHTDDGVKALPPVDIGSLLVLHTEQTTSTVVILNSAHSINKGERFRTPTQ